MRPLGRIRVLKNRHGSAEQALKKWLEGTLWGNPIRLGKDKFHVYGAWRRKWTIVFVEFLKDKIVVVRPVMA